MKRLFAIIPVVMLVVGAPTGVSAAERAVVTPAQIASARTAAEHEAIARSYEEEAVTLDKKAEMHQQMADTYKLGSKPSLTMQATHCSSLAETFRQAAQENRALAAEHHKMAVDAGK